MPLDRTNDGRIRLHIRRVPDGRVSSALDREILEGHRVRLSGPFGSAFLRPGMANRLILVGCGTGFAPVWSIADAAMHENPGRQMVLVVGARSVETLYMTRALCRLSKISSLYRPMGDPQRDHQRNDETVDNRD